MPETDEAGLPSSPRSQSPAKQSPAAAASPSEAGPKRAAALPPTPQLPRKQAKVAGAVARVFFRCLQRPQLLHPLFCYVTTPLLLPKLGMVQPDDCRSA